MQGSTPESTGRWGDARQRCAMPAPRKASASKACQDQRHQGFHDVPITAPNKRAEPAAAASHKVNSVAVSTREKVPTSAIPLAVHELSDHEAACQGP